MVKGGGLRRILQVSERDCKGGAAMVAWNLHRQFRERGMESWMAVGTRSSHDPSVTVIPNDASRNWYTQSVRRAQENARQSSGRAGWLDRLLGLAAEPGRRLARWRGIEDFDHPGTWRLLELTGTRPDVIHCHNLHQGYFDLRALPWLSRVVPVVLTLHDAWLLSGHCAHSFGCERWMTGCGKCPDLSIYPAAQRDSTAFNWKRKRNIARQSSLYVAAPSHWLLDQTKQSLLMPAVRHSLVIPNGVDLDIFHPGDSAAERAWLDIAPDALVLCFAAEGIRHNQFKDWSTLRIALQILGARVRNPRRKIIFLALGETAPAEQIGEIEVRSIPYTTEREHLARCYRASNVSVHAALAENFPLAIVEALACGTPVVASRVGGIPEIIRDGETGLLSPPREPEALAAAIERLLNDHLLAARFGRNGAADARARFSLRAQTAAYLEFYRHAQQDFSRLCASDRLTNHHADAGEALASDLVNVQDGK